jgi:hypothetical protein
MAVLTDPTDPNFDQTAYDTYTQYGGGQSAAEFTYDPTYDYAGILAAETAAGESTEQQAAAASASTTGSTTTDQTVAGELGATVTPGLQEYMSPEATVAGQLEGLLASDSPYIESARARADDVAQQMGMLSSSMAAGAAERAAIESAMPIATQDAKTYATGALAQQSQVDNLAALQYQADLQLQHEAYSQEAANYRSELETTAQMDIAGWELNSNERIAYMNAISSLGDQFIADASGIMNSSVLDAASKDAALASLKLNYQEALEFTQEAIGLDLGFGVAPTGTAPDTGATIPPTGATTPSDATADNPFNPISYTGTPDANGNITYPSGTVINTDGSVVLSSGTILNADGSVSFSSGSLFDPMTGELTTATGVVIPPDSTGPAGTKYYTDGTVIRTDGTVEDADGTVYNVNGSVTYTDGTTLNTDGSTTLVDGSIIGSDGSIITDMSLINPNSSLPDVSADATPKTQSPETQYIVDRTSDTYYANIAAASYPDYTTFNADLQAADGMNSGEFADFKNTYQGTIITGYEASQVNYMEGNEYMTTIEYIPTYGTLTDQQLWDYYSKIQYAALNPDATDATLNFTVQKPSTTYTWSGGYTTEGGGYPTLTPATLADPNLYTGIASVDSMPAPLQPTDYYLAPELRQEPLYKYYLYDM